MSNNYTGAVTLHTTITIPSDGDNPFASGVSAPFEALMDNDAYLLNIVTGLTNLSRFVIPSGTNGVQFDAGPTGALQIGNTNASSISIGNSTLTNGVLLQAQPHAHGAGVNAFALIVQNGFNDPSSHGVSILAGSNTTTNAYFVGCFRPDGTNIGGIVQNTASTVSFATSSDERLKANFRAITDGLERCRKIDVKSFEFKSDTTRRRHEGFIAQQLIEWFPDAVVAGDEDRTWTVDYGRITPLLVAAIQDLAERLDALESKA